MDKLFCRSDRLDQSRTGIGQSGEYRAERLFTDTRIDLVDDLAGGVLPDDRPEVVVGIVGGDVAPACG